MAFKKKKPKAKSKPPAKPKPDSDPVGFDEVPEDEWVTLPDTSLAMADPGPGVTRSKVTAPKGVPPRPSGAPPAEHCSHEFPGSEGKEFVYVIKPNHRDKYPSKKIVVPVD